MIVAHNLSRPLESGEQLIAEVSDSSRKIGQSISQRMTKCQMVAGGEVYWIVALGAPSEALAGAIGVLPSPTVVKQPSLLLPFYWTRPGSQPTQAQRENSPVAR